MLGKADKIIAIIVIGIGIILVSLFVLNKKPGSSVIVSVDGKEKSRYSLSENVDTVIEGVGGTNRLVIKNGTASVTDADCPDKLCVKQGEISNVGESIVCLPHRVTVRIEGDPDKDSPDAMTGR